jgi:hypothetical protein
MMPGLTKILIEMVFEMLPMFPFDKVECEVEGIWDWYLTSVEMRVWMCLLTGENDRPSTGRVEPVRGCLNNPSRLVWTTLTSLTAPLAALRSRKETKEKVDLS